MVQSMCRGEVDTNFVPRSVDSRAEDFVRTVTSSDLKQNSCLSMLFTDYTEAGGVCQGSHGDVELGWPVSQSVCSVENIYDTDPYHVVEGLCRPQTEQALRTDECIEQVGNLSEQGL